MELLPFLRSPSSKKFTRTASLQTAMTSRAGPPSQKWSDQQITVNPTGSIHKKAREKKFDPKKVDFDEGVLI